MRPETNEKPKKFPACHCSVNVRGLPHDRRPGAVYNRCTKLLRFWRFERFCDFGFSASCSFHIPLARNAIN